MHPDRGIIRTYIKSYGLSTIPDNRNTLTRKSINTNDAPSEPLRDHVTYEANKTKLKGLVQYLKGTNMRIILQAKQTGA